MATIGCSRPALARGLLLRRCIGTGQSSVVPTLASQPRPARQERLPVPPCQTSLAAAGRGAAASFSTTPVAAARKTRDKNRRRGLSTLYRSGLKEPLSVSTVPVPVPVRKVPPPETDPDHGLWEFFYSRDKALNTPQEDAAHGRAWTVEELRQKSWEDLQKLWWVCCKERNRIATGNFERFQQKIGFGAVEAENRDKTVKLTMRAIRHVLTERFYTWEDAVELAKTDPEINLAGTGSAYTPGAFLEDDTTSTEASEKAAGQENAAAEGAANRAADPALLEKSSPATEEPVKR